MPSVELTSERAIDVTDRTRTAVASANEVLLPGVELASARAMAVAAATRSAAAPANEGLLHGAELTYAWSASVIDALVRRGVRHVVVCPGSRSAPLALCVAERDELTIWTVPDERSAAFFALGVGMSTGVAAAMICTSGTAGANAYPAVIEASMSSVPLVIVTADRPPELHGFGALQTIEQQNLFGGYAETLALPAPEASPQSFAYLQASLARALALGTVVHINVPLREPLALEASKIPKVCFAVPAFFGATHAAPAVPGDLLGDARRILIVAGPARFSTQTRAAVAALAQRLHAPILAESSSGFRFGPVASRHAIAHYESIVRVDAARAALAPDLIIRIGGPLTTRVLQTFVDTCGASVVTFAEPGRVCDPALRSSVVLEGDTGALAAALPSVSAPDAKWLARWLAADAAASAALQLSLATDSTEPAFARTVLSTLPAGANLMLSNSMPIRDVDAFASKSARALEVFTSRGASGIDGVTSTAFGIAAATGRKTALLIGDTALLHDIGGLLWGKRLGLSLCIVVVNNAGGRIFEMLPVAQLTKRLEQLFVMPPQVELRHVATMAGATHHLVSKPQELETAIRAGLEGGVHLIEANAQGRDVLADHKRAWSAVEAALKEQRW